MNIALERFPTIHSLETFELTLKKIKKGFSFRVHTSINLKYSQTTLSRTYVSRRSLKLQKLFLRQKYHTFPGGIRSSC